MDAEGRDRSTRSLLKAARDADRFGRYEEAARLAEMVVAARAATDDVDARTAALVLRAALARYAGRLEETQQRLGDARVAAATSTVSSCTRAEVHLERPRRPRRTEACLREWCGVEFESKMSGGSTNQLEAAGGRSV